MGVSGVLTGATPTLGYCRVLLIKVCVFGRLEGGGEGTLNV